jgi:putative inorganic carbon (hco3(-)) transporter
MQVATQLHGITRPVTRPGFLEYGFWLFLLIAIGRLGELIPGLGDLPVGKIVLGITLLVVAAQWKQLPRMTTSARPLAKTARWLVILAVLLTPISIWKGASLAFLIHKLPVLFVSTAIAFMMSRSWRAIRGTIFVLILCGLVLARSALSSYTGGRAATDTMYDTNDLAYVLVTVFPLAIGFVLTARTTLRRMCYIGVSTTLVATSLLTQSRGGLLGLLTVIGLLVFMELRPSLSVKRRLGAKIVSLIAAACITLVFWSHLPTTARDRFATILNLGGDYNLDASDVTGRGQIWSRGIAAVIDRPVGYGPDSFSMVDLLRGGRFMAPHNSFVEILVELGVIGLILLVRTYVLAWQGLKRARQKLLIRGALSEDEADRAVFARMLQIALAGNAVAGFFLSMAYSTTLWVLFGTCMAVLSLVDQSTKVDQAAVTL